MDNKGITEELFCTRDEAGNLKNQVVCGICNKEFTWVDGLDCEAVVESVSTVSYYTRQEKHFNLRVRAKCPHCNFRAEYNQIYRDKIK